MDSQDSGHFSETEDQQIMNRKLARQEGFEKLMYVQDQILQEHDGVPFENTLGLLHGAREERDRELGLVDEDGGLKARPLTPGILAKVLAVHEEIRRSTNGRIFEDSTELIRQMREERTRELMERHNF